MAEAEPGAGDIPFELDGKAMALRPSLSACIAISKIGGGLNAAVQRCLALEMDTICEVVIAGLGLNPQQAKQVPDAVYKTGLISLSAPCVAFIHVVANGGRMPEDDEGGDDGEVDLDPPAPAFP